MPQASLRLLRALVLATCASLAATTLRTVYIAADEVVWNYAPQGRDMMTNKAVPSLVSATDGSTTTSPGAEPADGHHKSFVSHHHAAGMPDHGASLWLERRPNRIGPEYRKALYREYTDATFTSLKARPEAEQHLGLLGPVIRTVVGDTVKVVFRNNARFPYSVHAHGLRYTKVNEGAKYFDGQDRHPGDIVDPNGTYTYTWEVPEEAGPGPSDGSSVAWLYHSHVDEPMDTNAGLFGVITVAAAGTDAERAVPDDIDRELFLGFVIIDEGESQFMGDNIQQFLNASGTLDTARHDALWQDLDFAESNKMHGINGLVYGNLPGLNVKENERVRWYLFALGNQKDLHTVHWHGNTVLDHGARLDVATLMPAKMNPVDMVPYNPGVWMVQCHVNHHIHGGMVATYTVLESPKGKQQGLLDKGDASSRINKNFTATMLLVVLLVAFLAFVLYKRPRDGGAGAVGTHRSPATQA